jgi:hypothetical protein
MFTADRKPSLKQMAVRMLTGHVMVLSLTETGGSANTTSWGQEKGLRRCRATLRAWGAIDEAGSLTETGKALLEMKAGAFGDMRPVGCR